MLFGLINLKRKFSAVEGRDDDSTSTHDSEAASPRKRLRVEETASIREAATHNTQDACTASNEEERKKTTKAELRAKLEEYEEVIARVKKESERDLAVMKKLTEETMVCMICQDMVQNPQILQCGHSACYSCLRSWWTQPIPENLAAPIIDTVAESDANAEADPALEPRPRRRHKFRSAVHVKKYCPYCNEQIADRPIPALRMRDVVETLNDDLALLPPNIQARREARRDLWHGIFLPETQLVVIVEPQPPAPPAPLADPILNDFAQAQFRRAVEEEAANRQRARDQAFEDGRRIGYLLTNWQLDGAEARRAAAGQPRQRLVFGGGHPPLPAAGPVVRAPQGVPLLRLNPEGPIQGAPPAPDP